MREKRKAWRRFPKQNKQTRDPSWILFKAGEILIIPYPRHESLRRWSKGKSLSNGLKDQSMPATVFHRQRNVQHAVVPGRKGRPRWLTHHVTRNQNACTPSGHFVLENITRHDALQPAGYTG